MIKTVCFCVALWMAPCMALVIRAVCFLYGYIDGCLYESSYRTIVFWYNYMNGYLCGSSCQGSIFIQMMLSSDNYALYSQTSIWCKLGTNCTTITLKLGIENMKIPTQLLCCEHFTFICNIHQNSLFSSDIINLHFYLLATMRRSQGCHGNILL